MPVTHLNLPPSHSSTMLNKISGALEPKAINVRFDTSPVAGRDRSIPPFWWKKTRGEFPFYRPEIGDAYIWFQCCIQHPFQWLKHVPTYWKILKLYHEVYWPLNSAGHQLRSPGAQPKFAHQFDNLGISMIFGLNKPWLWPLLFSAFRKMVRQVNLSKMSQISIESVVSWRTNALHAKDKNYVPVGMAQNDWQQ